MEPLKKNLKFIIY